MSKYLTTFSGKFGDILWSMPTVRAISRMVGEPVDFACMPAYRSLIPLLESQEYIDKAFVVEDWICVHSNHGDQPWNPPEHVEQGYERFWHLGYRGHPGINAEALPLIDFTASQQGIRLQEPVVPFITAHKSDDAVPRTTFVAYAFNEQYAQQKRRFEESLRLRVTCVQFINISTMPWQTAAAVLSSCLCFVGCRSANWVLAHAVGAKIVSYEPHPARNYFGSLGKIFGNPHHEEITFPHEWSPERTADAAALAILRMAKEKEDAVIESQSR